MACPLMITTGLGSMNCQTDYLEFNSRLNFTIDASSLKYLKGFIKSYQERTFETVLIQMFIQNDKICYTSVISFPAFALLEARALNYVLSSGRRFMPLSQETVL